MTVEELIESAPQRRFRRYPAYHGSGVEWLGEMPRHWDVVRMWRIASASSGGTPARDDLRFWGGDIPWVSPKDMKRRWIASSEETITEAAVAETGIKLISPPVVLIVVRGMILAHSFPVAVTTAPLTINQDMKALRLVPGIEPEFLAWLFEGLGKPILGEVVDEAAHGTRVIRMERWRSLVTMVPPVAEQRAIAAFLDRETARIDALVTKKERLIELLQEKRSALVTRAVTEGLDPNVPMKESGVEWLGEIPSHWEVKRIRDVATSLQTGPFGSQLHASDYVIGGYPVINPANLRGDSLVEDPECAVDAQTAQRLAHHRLETGDILFARRGELGRCGLVGEGQEGWLCGTGCLRLRVSDALVRSGFLMRLLSTPWVAKWLELQSVGATMQNINTSIIGRIPVALPPMVEQEHIDQFLGMELAKIDLLVAKIRTAIDHLHELRTALISAAVTGKIDVREEAP